MAKSRENPSKRAMPERIVERFKKRQRPTTDPDTKEQRERDPGTGKLIGPRAPVPDEPVVPAPRKPSVRKPRKPRKP